MGLKVSIDTAEFDSLDEKVREHYKQDGDGYKLDADFEDTDGLKNKNSQLLSEVKKLKGRQIPEGFDLDKAIEALEFQDKSERELAIKRGEFDKVRNAMEEKHNLEKAELIDKLSNLVANNAEKDLTVKLVQHGVIESKAGRMAKLLRLEDIKPVQKEDGDLVWRSLDDTQTIDLEKFIPSLRDEWGEFFKPTVASGGGAAGSRITSTNSGELKRSKMSTADKVAYVKQHGQEAYNKLPN